MVKKLDRRRFEFDSDRRRRMIDSSSLLKLTGSLICVCGGDHHGSWFVDLRVRGGNHGSWFVDLRVRRRSWFVVR
eukprot:scaffold18613_cov26-Cyclotella_meneghiniana.AAC.1